MVVEPGETFIEEPLPTNEPPQAPEYQNHWAPVPREPPETNKVVEPPQVGFGLALAEDGAPDCTQEGA